MKPTNSYNCEGELCAYIGIIVGILALIGYFLGWFKI